MCFFKDFIYLFLEREGGRKRGREKHGLVASHTPPPTGDLAHNSGMCPDQESNQRPVDLQASARSTEPHQPGLCMWGFFLISYNYKILSVAKISFSWIDYYYNYLLVYIESKSHIYMF